MRFHALQRNPTCFRVRESRASEEIGRPGNGWWVDWLSCEERSSFPSGLFPLIAYPEMAEPHSSKDPKSPMSLLLQKMGLTRSDLARHSEQMRQFLSDEVSDSQDQDDSQSSQRDSKPSRSSSLARSRASSFANASGVTQSPTPPLTPIKAEPVDNALPGRSADTMEMVMERKRMKSKQSRGLCLLLSISVICSSPFYMCCRLECASARRQTRSNTQRCITLLRHYSCGL